jgi:hypothetical protein
MADETREEDLLQSMERVDIRVRDFRNRVRALLAQIESARARDAEANARRSVS